MRIGDKLNTLKKERNAAIEKLLRGGCTYLRIAELVGCSIGQVQFIAKEKGLLKRSQQMDAVEPSEGTTVSADEMCIMLGAVDITDFPESMCDGNSGSVKENSDGTVNHGR